MRLGRCQQAVLIELAMVGCSEPMLSRLVDPIRGRGCFRRAVSWWKVRMEIYKVLKALERRDLVKIEGSDTQPVSDPMLVALTVEGAKIAVALAAAEELENF